MQKKKKDWVGLTFDSKGKQTQNQMVERINIETNHRENKCNTTKNSRSTQAQAHLQTGKENKYIYIVTRINTLAGRTIAIVITTTTKRGRVILDSSFSCCV